MRGKPTEEVLDFAIARLRALLPAGATAPASAPAVGAFHLPTLAKIPDRAKP